jgi:hypothetical protein
MRPVSLPALILAFGFLAVSFRAEAACLRLDGGSGRVSERAVPLGGEVRLRFRHSIWGALVEEQFRVASEGLELVRLRYAEERLVEFYGHEGARQEGNWWVVEDGPRRFANLWLRVSRESEMRLLVGAEPIPLWTMAEPGGVIRLCVTGCGSGPPEKEGDRHAGRGD